MDSRLVILPTARKVEEELKRLSRERCVMGHRLMTFPQLVDSLWHETVSPPRLIDPLGERLVVDEAIRRAEAMGVAISSSRGLAASIVALIRQLKSAGVTPDDLGASAGVIQPESRPSLVTTTTIFREYENLLAEKRIADSHDRERFVVGMLHEAERDGRRPRFLDGVTHLLIAELYDLSLLQFMIAASLIRLIGDAELTIQAASHKVDGNSFADLTWNRFVGEESIADKVLPHFVHRGGREGQLGFALEHLFTNPAPPPPPIDGSIQIIEASNLLDEVKQTAKAIRRMLEAPTVDNGRPPKLGRIGIVARDLAPYADYLETVFARYKLPLRIANTPRLRATAPSRIMLDLLKLPAEDYSRPRLESLVSSPYFDTGISPSAARLMAEIGYIDESAGPLATRFDLAIADARSNAEQAEDRASRERWLRRAERLERAAASFSWMLALCASLASTKTLAGHVAKLDQVLADLRFNPARDEAEGHQIAAALRQTLDALTLAGSMIAPDRGMTPREFADHLEDALSERTLDPTSSSGAIEALPVLEARGLDFDCIFILGLNDGAFPRYRGDDPIITDDLRQVLNRSLSAAVRDRFGAYAAAAPGPILRMRHHHNAEDWFLFFLALSMPERRVILSYPAGDERGNPLTRSPFIDEVLRLTCLDSAPPELFRRAAGEQFLPTAAGAFTRSELLNAAAIAGLLDNSCAEVIGPRAELDSIMRRVRIERHREDYLSRPAREDTDGNLPDPEKLALADQFDGRVSADARLRALLLGSDHHPRPWSPTQFEEVAACAFKFFAGRILRLREEDDPGHESSALESGLLAHRILHELLARKPDFTQPAVARAAALELLRQRRLREEPRARDHALFDIEWTRLERIVDEFVVWECAQAGAIEARSARTLTERELRFTLDDARTASADEPIHLAINGRIDRLDLFHDAEDRISHVRVIDYKTARRGNNYERLLADGSFGFLSLQLPIYLIGALAEFKPELAANYSVEAGYLILRGRKKDLLKRFTPEGLMPVADRLIELTASAIAGRFDVDPLECSEFCGFRRLCRYNKSLG
jgi:ATP-dependent helicase/DNAse subunit B